MGGAGRAIEYLDHDPLPLHAVRANASGIDMMDNPVGHFVRHDLCQKGIGLLAVQRHVKAQPATPIMGLSGTAPTQVIPDPWRRQRRVALAGSLERSLDMGQKPGPTGIPDGKLINVAGWKIGHG